MAHMIRCINTEKDNKVVYMPVKLTQDKELMKRHNLVIQDNEIKEAEILKPTIKASEDKSLVVVEKKKRGPKPKVQTETKPTEE